MHQNHNNYIYNNQRSKAKTLGLFLCSFSKKIITFFYKKYAIKLKKLLKRNKFFDITSLEIKNNRYGFGGKIYARKRIA